MILDAKRPVTTPTAPAHSRPVRRPSLRRESARRAPNGEGRNVAPAQRTAAQHGDDGAVACSFQRSAISFQPVFARADALGRAAPPNTLAAPRTRKARAKAPSEIAGTMRPVTTPTRVRSFRGGSTDSAPRAPARAFQVFGGLPLANYRQNAVKTLRSSARARTDPPLLSKNDPGLL